MRAFLKILDREMGEILSMQQQVVTKLANHIGDKGVDMNFTDKERVLHQWISDVSKNRPELGGFPICPYAFKSKNKITECEIDDITPENGYDVIIFIVQDNLSVLDLQNHVKRLNDLYQNYSFFEDCASRDTFINGVKTNNPKFNLILAQPKEKLTKYRVLLAKTDYYEHWDSDYLKEILENDIKIVNQNKNK